MPQHMEPSPPGKCHRVAQIVLDQIAVVGHIMFLDKVEVKPVKFLRRQMDRADDKIQIPATPHQTVGLVGIAHHAAELRAQLDGNAVAPALHRLPVLRKRLFPVIVGALFTAVPVVSIHMVGNADLLQATLHRYPGNFRHGQLAVR